MARYERFLSYLFEYDGDTKGRNCGFAKIEVRGDTRRIQIVLKGRTPVELLHVCGFYRDGGYCVCVPLGRMMINGGSGQFQYAMSGNIIRGTGAVWDQLRGLVISSPNEAGRAYATVWDDEAFGLSKFKQAEQPQESGEVHPGWDNFRSGEQALSEELKPPKEESKPPEPSLKEQEEPEPTEEASATESKPPEGLSLDEPEAVEEPLAEEPDDGVVLQAESFDAPKERDEIAADLFWANLCRRFRRIEALPHDHIVCLKAMPADIGRLPRPNWVYGSNGFVMYSYVRFRYIAFARVARDKFELWLPGTYEHNEELLAGMFGFAQFRCAKSAEPQAGDFGYWCVPISVLQQEMSGAAR